MSSENAKDGIRETTPAAVAAPRPRIEDFPIDTFRHLEAVIHRIRVPPIDFAAEHAASRQPDGDSYSVTLDDIDAGLLRALELERQMSTRA